LNYEVTAATSNSVGARSVTVCQTLCPFKRTETGCSYHRIPARRRPAALSAVQVVRGFEGKAEGLVVVVPVGSFNVITGV